MLCVLERCFEAPATPQAIDGLVLRRLNQPGARVLWRALGWPLLERGGESVVHDLFREGEVAAQRANQARRDGGGLGSREALEFGNGPQDRPHLYRAGFGGGNARRDAHGLAEVFGFDDVEPAQLLARLGERAASSDRLARLEPDIGGGAVLSSGSPARLGPLCFMLAVNALYSPKIR